MDSGEPMARWIEEIDNDGLIYYRMIFNAERLILTTPKAIGEVLVQKSYEFIKPTFLRGGIAQILGVGLVLAEGDEHRVCTPAYPERTNIDHFADAAKESHASIQLSACQGFISSLLVKVDRAGDISKEGAR